MDKYSSFPVQRSISPYPTYAKFNAQDVTIERRNQSFNISSVNQGTTDNFKNIKQTSNAQQHRTNNFLAEPVSEGEDKRKKMHEEYNRYVHDEFKKRNRNIEKDTSNIETQGKVQQIGSKEIQRSIANKDFNVYRPQIRNEGNERFQGSLEEYGNKVDTHYDQPKYDWSKLELPHSTLKHSQYDFSINRNPYRELPPFRSELSYYQELSRKRLNEPPEAFKELIKEPIRESIIKESTIKEPPRGYEDMDPLDASYISPIIRTKYHSSMEYSDVEKLRQDQQRAFYQDLEQQLQEKRQREEEKRKRTIENERREEEKVRKEREELKKKFRTELKKEHPTLYSEETHRKPPELDSNPTSQSIKKQEPPKPILKHQPTVITANEKPELGSFNIDNLPYTQNFDTKLGLINEHAGLRYLIDQLKREASDAAADKELAQRELEKLKEGMKSRVNLESSYTIQDTGYNYRTPYYRSLNQIEVSYIPLPEKQPINDRRFLSFAGKSIMSSPVLSSGYYPAKTYIDKHYDSILYKPVSTHQLEVRSTSSFEYPSQDTSSLFITQENESFSQESQRHSINERNKDASLRHFEIESYKSSIHSVHASSPKLHRRTSNKDSELETNL